MNTTHIPDVWSEAQRQLCQTPNLPPQELFRMIRKQHPDQFSDGQLRTLQRRVQAWRIAYIAAREEIDPVTEISPSDG